MKLPRVSGKQVIDALLKFGFIVHHVRGSHYILKNPETGCRVTVPYHRKELVPKTLSSILKHTHITQEDFRKSL